jgi:hypothetical protein
MKLSTVYRRAALNHLWTGDGKCHSVYAKSSCDAVSLVRAQDTYSPLDARVRAVRALSDCRQNIWCPFAWSDTSRNLTEVQAERFMWLWLLALEAEDEGL